MVKYSFLDEKIVYQSFYGAPLTFSYFFFKEKLCVSARVGKLFAKRLLSEDPRWKNDISGFIWHKSFIQTVKCSSFYQRIVYQGFYGTLLKFSYFYVGKRFCVSGRRRQVVSEMFFVWSVPKTLSKKWYLRLYLTQIVHSNSKMLFL